MSKPAERHVVLTGPVDRSFTLADGRVYDCAPLQVDVDSAEHAAELAHLIGQHYEAAGHPALVDENGVQQPFRHTRPEHVKPGLVHGINDHLYTEEN